MVGGRQEYEYAVVYYENDRYGVYTQQVFLTSSVEKASAKRLLTDGTLYKLDKLDVELTVTLK